jgi:hypothetical protein
MRRRLVRGATVLLLSGMAAGCFRYAPVEVSEVRPGERVRADLTPVAAAMVADETGRPGRVVEGNVLEPPGDGPGARLLLSVSSRDSRGRDGFRSSVALDPAEIRGVELRSFDAFRTILTAGVAAVAAGFAVDALFDGRGSGDGPEVPGPNEAAGWSIPVLRVPF